MKNERDKVRPGNKPSPASDEERELGRQRGLAERSVTEHHVPGADGPLGAEAEEDNNP